MTDKTLMAKLHELAKGWRDRVDVDPTDPYTEGESHALFECAQNLTAAMVAARNATPPEGQSVEQRAAIKCPWDEGSPCLQPRPVGMVYRGVPEPRAFGYLDKTGVEWAAYDTGQMEAYARVSYSDGWEAGYAAALTAQAPSEAVAIVGERGSVSWRSDSILPVGAKLYAAPQARGVDFLPNGSRVMWQDSVGDQHPGTITAYHPATYSAKLDDGTDANEYGRGRFALIASASGVK